MTHDALLTIGKTVVSGLGGVLIGWTVSSALMGPRVDAIEKGQARIESLVLTLIQAKGLEAPQAVKP